MSNAGEEDGDLVGQAGHLLFGGPAVESAAAVVADEGVPQHFRDQLDVEVGAQFAAPDKRVVCLSGDGSFQMCTQELMTATVYNLPIITLIVNATIAVPMCSNL